jgi:ABC-2 type transport system permease protein
MITALRALVHKDLRIFFGDRRAVVMSFVAPIVIASFFGYIFGGLGGKTETSKIPILVVDQDGSEISRDVFARLSEDKALSAKPATLDDARSAVKKGSATVAVVIPPNFGADAGQALFTASTKPGIGVLYDPSHGAEQAMVQGILAGSVMQSVFKGMFSGQTGQNVLENSLADIEKNTSLPPAVRSELGQMLRSAKQLNERALGGQGGVAPSLTMPYEVHEEAVTARTGVEYNGYAHSFGGMGVQFILFMGIDAGIGMLLQRQRGLWKRFRAAPLSKGLLLGSRALSSTVIAMVILMVIFGFARVVFGVRIEGSMAGFLGVCLAFSLMTAAFGLLVAALGKTPEATRGLAIFVTLIMVMLGGAWVPAFIFPQWLQKVTMVMPTRWAVDGLDAMVWRGLGFQAAVGPMLVLFGSAVVFGVLAVTRFRWEAEG